MGLNSSKYLICQFLSFLIIGFIILILFFIAEFSFDYFTLNKGMDKNEIIIF